MKQIIQTEGIVLKVVEYKEQAVLAEILTKTGKKNYIIRGAKKITSGTRLLAEPLTRISFLATSSDGLDTLTEGSIVDSYLPIKQDINKMLCFYPILEKIIVFTQQVTSIDTFYQFVIDILELLKKDIDVRLVLALFEVKLTYLIGIAPELRVCLKCNKKVQNAVFSVYDGGVYCLNCINDGFDLNVNQTKVLQLLYFIKVSKVDKAFEKVVKTDISKILNIMDLYYQKHLDFISKAKEVTKEII